PARTAVGTSGAPPDRGGWRRACPATRGRRLLRHERIDKAVEKNNRQHVCLRIGAGPSADNSTNIFSDRRLGEIEVGAVKSVWRSFFTATQLIGTNLTQERSGKVATKPARGLSKTTAEYSRLGALACKAGSAE